VAPRRHPGASGTKPLRPRPTQAGSSSSETQTPRGRRRAEDAGDHLRRTTALLLPRRRCRSPRPPFIHRPARGRTPRRLLLENRCVGGFWRTAAVAFKFKLLLIFDKQLFKLYILTSDEYRIHKFTFHTFLGVYINFIVID